VAAIPWGKYERSDWVRVPGGARNYALRSNPKITISRRQYDQHYGPVLFHGTYEKKARVNAQSPLQLLRPARGRKSALKLAPAEKEKEIGKRRVIKQETEQQKLINKLQSQKVIVPKTVSLRNFKKGKQIRKFRTNVDWQEIESIRKAGEKSRIIFGYWVGLEMVSERDGQRKDVSLFTQRDIHWPFTEDDLDTAMDMAEQKTYANLTGMWIALHLTRAAAIKNGAKPK
jgi:hypothetical protein